MRIESESHVSVERNMRLDRHSNYLSDCCVEQFELLSYNFNKPLCVCMHKDYIFVFYSNVE